jgi:chaperonin GroEL (HSP60 family)
MTSQDIDQFYEGSPWAKLAKQAGLKPSETESSARLAFQFCAERFADIAKLCEDNTKGETEKLNRIARIVRGQ